MEQISWPKSVGFPPEWNQRAENIFNNLNGSNNENINIEVYEYGGGRRTYDISHITDVPAVLKVAINNYGIKEIDREIEQRKKIQEPFKSRLVPIVESGYGRCVQPKCEEARNDTSNKLQSMFESIDMKDYSEIYYYNVGLWNGKPVIFDYGGIDFKV